MYTCVHMDEWWSQFIFVRLGWKAVTKSYGLLEKAANTPALTDSFVHLNTPNSRGEVSCLRPLPRSCCVPEHTSPNGGKVGCYNVGGSCEWLSDVFALRSDLENTSPCFLGLCIVFKYAQWCTIGFLSPLQRRRREPMPAYEATFIMVQFPDSYPQHGKSHCVGPATGTLSFSSCLLTPHLKSQR